MIQKNNIFTVAIAGGIASGKTTITSMFESLGIKIIKADHHSKLVINKPEIIKTLYHKFGECVLSNQNKINRKVLRKIIISNFALRMWINEFLHPIIINSINYSIASIDSSLHPYVLVEVPLLNSKTIKYYPYFKKIIFVKAPMNLRLKRIMTRDLQSFESACLIIRSQILSNEKRLKEDYTIYNLSSLNFLKKQVLSIDLKIRSIIRSRRLVNFYTSRKIIC